MMKKIIADILKKGGVGILATDTLYGIVGSAFSKQAVSRIYRLRKRNLDKPMIILIGSLDDLYKFDIKLSSDILKKLQKIWPAKVSIILPCFSRNFSYLHRGKNSLAFRLPAKKTLRELIRKTGPLVAPSVNIEGMLPAKNLKEAKKYFGDKVDFYKKGITSDNPSKIIKFEGKKTVTIR